MNAFSLISCSLLLTCAFATQRNANPKPKSPVIENSLGEEHAEASGSPEDSHISTLEGRKVVHKLEKKISMAEAENAKLKSQVQEYKKELDKLSEQNHTYKLERIKSIEHFEEMIFEEHSLLKDEAEQVSKNKELNDKIEKQQSYIEKLSLKNEKKANEVIRRKYSSFQ